MLFRELNRGKCKTYLVACEETRRAVLVDPLKEKLERYIGMLAYHGLRLEAVIDTHTHADHRTASFDLRELVGATAIMHRRAPAPHIDRHVDDGDTIAVGNVALRDALMHYRPKNATRAEVTGVTLDVQTGDNLPAPDIDFGSLQVKGVNIVFGDMYLFQHWKFTDEPTLTLGMDLLGSFDVLIIDYNRHELQIRSRQGPQMPYSMHY